MDQNLERESEQWIARFAPLILNDKPLSGDQLRARLDSIEQLRTSGSQLWSQVEASPDVREELKTTLMSALEQLPSIRYDLLDAMENLRQGRPLNLNQVQDTLADREARQEMRLSTSVVPKTLRIKTENAAPERVGGAFLGISMMIGIAFLVRWELFLRAGATAPTSFILVGCSILAFVGAWAMVRTSLDKCQNEEVYLDGQRLTIHRYFGPFDTRRTYTLAEGAKVSEINYRDSERRRLHALVVNDANGAEIRFGSNQNIVDRRMQIIEEMNNYLSHQQP
ncbi:MAG: hypothetical protein JNJ45_01020 [Chthonomonas sp.]|nr:hypothetical protein [Chthonomonas sp.]